MLRSRSLVSFALQLNPLQVAALALAPALALEAGADPGAQQDRVERLGEIILGTSLDAADNGIDLLQARDHDHRNGVQALICLEPLEHLETVEVGHHQIEQDQIELLDREDLERPPARLGAGYAMAVARQAAEQQVAVAGIVVDHQNLAGLLGPRIVRPDRLHGPDQIEDHAVDGTWVLAGKLRAPGAAREVHDHVDARAQALGFSEQGFEIGAQWRAALLAQLLQQEFGVALDRVERVAQIVADLGLNRVDLGARGLRRAGGLVEQAVHQPEQVIGGV